MTAADAVAAVKAADLIEQAGVTYGEPEAGRQLAQEVIDLLAAYLDLDMKCAHD